MECLITLKRIYEILKAIGQNPKITTNKLHEQLKYPKASLIWYLERLNKAGLIARLEDYDAKVPYYYKRPKQHILTPKGKEFFNALDVIIPFIDDLLEK